MAKLYFYYWRKSLFGDVNKVPFFSEHCGICVRLRQALPERDTVV